MSPKVSITVPVYNVENSLPRCIESLINQTLKDIEIIIVDDGSTDASGVICDKYARIDGRIRVIHKPNGGLASARQCGLDMITGEYYTVCDSDDWVEPKMYEELYNMAIKDDADIVLSNHYVNYPNGKQVENIPYKYKDQETYILDIMYRNVSANTWNKLFKVATIKKNNIAYKEGINLGEDALFLYNLLLQPLRISSINKPFYHYQRDMNSDTYTNCISLKSVNQSVCVWKWKLEHFVGEKYARAHKYSTINLAFLALRAEGLDKEYFYSIVENISCKDIIKYRLLSLKAILIIVIKVFGLRLGRYIYHKLYKYFYK